MERKLPCLEISDNWRAGFKVLHSYASDDNVVYLAEHIKTGTKVIIKEIYNERVYRVETAATKYLEHHRADLYFPRIYAAFKSPLVDDDIFVIIEEYIIGLPLDRVHIDTYRLYTLLVQLFDLISKLNSVGFHHGDIHTSNII